MNKTTNQQSNHQTELTVENNQDSQAMNQLNNQSVNLIELAKRLSLTATSLLDTLKKQDKPIYLTQSKLVSKVPELASIDDAIALFRFTLREDKTAKPTTLTVYQDNGLVGLYDASLNPLNDDFTITNYLSGISGYCLVKHKSGLDLVCSMSVNNDYLVDNPNDIEGQGMPDSQIVGRLPKPETPLHSKLLPSKVTLEVIETGKKSKEYGTLLVTLKNTLTNEVFKDVLCNAELERLVIKQGIGSKFKIVNVRERRNKEGLPIDKDGKVNKKKPSYIVDILSDDGLDFSDLKL